MNKISRRMKLAVLLALCVAVMIGLVGCGNSSKSALDPKNPVTITIWNYYNGDQLAAFETLLEEFNNTIGLEKGIVAMSVSQGDINTLADALIAAVNGDAGAQEKPTLASIYAETAFILDNADALAPMDSYFTEEELAKYVSGFIDEGRFNAENELLSFPILKSTELFTINETDWEPFAEETGVTIESLKTKEDLTAAAAKYYEWTDAQTPDVVEDGKALYGRDSMANYIFIGSYQLGHELFSIKNGELTIDMDRDTFKRLWDNFYVPYINGYFGAYAKFRSEDCKTGKILALTSSSSSSGYLPTAVTLADDTTHDINIRTGLTLPFEGVVNDAVVQQGANYSLLKSSPAQQEGAVEFLKWFSEPERNLTFAMMSGYSPVTLASNTTESIESAYDGDAETPKGRNVFNALLFSAEAFGTKEAYATKPFSGGKEVRSIMEDAMDAIAQTDRETVLAQIEAGATREEAVAPFVSDEYFDAWFTSLVEQINTAIGK